MNLPQIRPKKLPKTCLAIAQLILIITYMETLAKSHEIYKKFI